MDKAAYSKFHSELNSLHKRLLMESCPDCGGTQIVRLNPHPDGNVYVHYEPDVLGEPCKGFKDGVSQRISALQNKYGILR